VRPIGRGHGDQAAGDDLLIWEFRGELSQRRRKGTIAKGTAVRPPSLRVQDTKSRAGACRLIVRIYNSERPHDSLGRVPPLTFLPRPTTAGQSSWELSA
jgi:hypothetical protein